MKKIIGLVALSLLVGCSSTGTNYGKGGAGTGINSTAYRSPYDVNAKSYTEEELLASTTIYFDFDKTNVKNDFYDLILAHGDYLAKNTDKRARLVGHTDERGTREYNLALGEKRSDAIAEMLMVNGVAKGQLEKVSYGEESPAAVGHEESAWKMNRRVEIEY